MNALLEVRDLHVAFRSQGRDVPAVQGVSFSVHPGQTVAVVGESGSGKSTSAAAAIGLLPGTGRVTGGQVLFEGRDITRAGRRELVGLRGRSIGLVPQDPMSNLNPVWTIGHQVREAQARPEIIREPRAFRVTQVEGLGTFAVAPQAIVITPRRALPAEQPYHPPWTQQTVRYAA